MTQRKLAYIYVLFAATMWGTIGVSVRILSLFQFTSIQMVVARLSVSAVFLGGFLGIMDKEKLKINWKDLKWFFGTGILSMLFFNTCYCTTVQLTSLSVAAVLLYTSPIFVMLISIPTFSEKITFRKVIAILLSVTGCALVSGIFSSNLKQIPVKGILFGLCAAAGYSFYSIFARILLQKYHSLTIIFYTFLFAGIGGALIGNATGIIHIFAKQPISLLAVVGIALTCSVLPYILYTKALMQIEASRASVMASIEPVVATIIGILIYSEKISVSGIVGILCVLTGIGVLNAKQKE